MLTNPGANEEYANSDADSWASFVLNLTTR